MRQFSVLTSPGPPIGGWAVLITWQNRRPISARLGRHWRLSWSGVCRPGSGGRLVGLASPLHNYLVDNYTSLLELCLHHRTPPPPPPAAAVCHQNTSSDTSSVGAAEDNKHRLGSLVC